MDTTIHLDAVKRPDTDVSFKAKFPKARERTPQTRPDFQDVIVALVNDEWEHQLTVMPTQKKISDMAQKFLDALTNVVGSDKAVKLPGKRIAARFEDWRAECVYLSLIDAKDKPDAARSLFSRHKRELIAANRIACQNSEFAWLIY